MVGGRLITSNLTSCDTGGADGGDDGAGDVDEGGNILNKLTNGGLKMIQLNNRNLLSEIGNVEYLKHFKR